jgi:aminoglycoside 3-N-acetyltransferase
VNPQEPVTREQLESDFRQLPVVQPRLLALHSSLSKIGFVQGGAPTVVEALLRGLGPQATVMAPVFTYSFSSIGDWPPFDYEKSPSLVGAVSEALRRHPQALRSFHPSHSVSAIGPRAVDLTRAHLASTPLGEDSPFHRLARWGGQVLLLGCDHRSNSLLHVAEVLAGMVYVDIPFSRNQKYESARIKRDGRDIVWMDLFQAPGCSRGFYKAEPVLREAGVIVDCQVGRAKSQIFSAQAALDALIPALREKPDLMLCEFNDCEICPRRREAVA